MSAQSHAIDRFAGSLFALAELFQITRKELCSGERVMGLALDHELTLSPPSRGSLVGRLERAMRGAGGPLTLLCWDKGGKLDQVLCHLLKDLATVGRESLTALDFTLNASSQIALDAKKPFDEKQVRQFFSRLKHASSVRLRLSMADKGKLAAAEEVTVRVFLCLEVLTFHLEQPLPEIEQELLAGIEKVPLIILVAGHDIALRGEHLAVVGGRYLPAWIGDLAR
jgi:hypothetical protein